MIIILQIVIAFNSFMQYQCVSTYSWLLGLLVLSKGGHGVLKVHIDLSACCAHEGKTSTDVCTSVESEKLNGPSCYFDRELSDC